MSGSTQHQIEAGQNQREYFRVIYPPDARPEISGTSYQIIDICCEGIRFYCPNQEHGSQCPVSISQPLKLKIRFHDKEIVEVQGKIVRCYFDNVLGAKVYCGSLTKGVDPKRIMDEQRYLLKHFPDFFRYS